MSVRRAFLMTVAVGMGATGAGEVRGQEQVPDSALALEPVMVRVLRSTIGTGAPSPISLAAGAELTRGNAGAFLEEALRAVPGIQIHNRFNFAVGERLAVRGFGPRAQFGVRGLRVLVDGIPATLPDGQATLDHLDLAGLGRVEALRGPASSLYGNAAGGVLHFRTLDPRTTPASVSLRTTSGSHGLLTVQGTTSGTSGGVGYRLGFSNVDYDGFRGDSVASDGSTYGQARRSVVNGTLTVPVGDGTLRFVTSGVDLDAENPGSLPAANIADRDFRAWNFNVVSGTGKTVRQGQLGASWTRPLAGADAEVSTWGIRRELENPIPGTVVGVDRNAGGVRALFTGSTPRGTGALSWGAGFEVELQRDDRKNWDNDGGDKGALELDQLEDVTGTGLFGQARLDLGSGVSLLGGLRYDRIAFSATDVFPVSGTDPDDSGERTMDAVSPSVGLVVRTGPDWELFGSVATSFETPTTTELGNQESGSGGFNPLLDPQRGLTFEGGARGRLGSTWNVEGTLFRTQLTDELVSFQVPTDPGRDYFRNVGESHHTGWEVALDGRPSPEVSVRIAYTRVDARFDVFETGGTDHSGNRVPGLAPYRVDALLILERGTGYLELRGLGQDAVPVDDAGTAESDAYVIAEARAGLHELRVGTMSLSPFVAVENLFDTQYNASVIPNAFGSRYFEPGPPRTYRIGLGVTWGY